ncbi:MAG: ABC transporter permease [Puniceicoccales bacterium]|jgi:oligopeptide transport system permease protein|nr:ABC transporter permease [Puniceicoccales bacterium]
MKSKSKKNWLLYISFFYIIGAVLVCFCGQRFLKYTYFMQDLDLGAVAPCAEHLFGTDIYGRDMLSRLLYGGKISLTVGSCVTLVAMIFGTFYGIVSGYAGGMVDLMMMRFVDVLYPIPLILLVILFMVFFGKGYFILFLAMVFVEWLTPARVIRSEVMLLKETGFVLAAKCLGQSRLGVIRKHIFPNLVGLIGSYAALMLPSVILMESFLSFIGVGVQAPRSSIGLLIADGTRYMDSYPWLLTIPCLLFVFMLLSLNIIAESISAKRYRLFV